MNFKRILKHILARLPEVIPNGVNEFNTWSDDIIDLYGFPKNDSIKWTLAAVILELPPNMYMASKHFFAKRLYKAAANEVASFCMYSIKEKQKAEQKAAVLAAQQAVVSNEPGTV